MMQPDFAPRYSMEITLLGTWLAVPQWTRWLDLATPLCMELRVIYRVACLVGWQSMDFLLTTRFSVMKTGDPHYIPHPWPWIMCVCAQDKLNLWAGERMNVDSSTPATFYAVASWKNWARVWLPPFSYSCLLAPRPKRNISGKHCHT